MRFTKLSGSHRIDHAIYLRISPLLALILGVFAVAGFAWPEGLGLDAPSSAWFLVLFAVINGGYAVVMRSVESIPDWASAARVGASAGASMLLFTHVNPTRSPAWVLLLLPFLGQVANESKGRQLYLRFALYVGVTAYPYIYHYPRAAADFKPWFWTLITQGTAILGLACCAWIVRHYDRLQRRSLFAAYNKLAAKQNHLLRLQRFAALGELSSGVSHEVNNALVVLVGGIDEVELAIAANDPNREDSLKNVDRMRRATDRVHRITDQIRKLSRDFRQEPTSIFDLRDVLDDILFLVRARLSNRGIAWEAQVGGDPVLVKGHPGEIGQVLINLINNARDALEGHAGERKIVFKVSGGGGVARLEVSDTGPGIPEDFKLKIFTPFATTKSQDKGTGLGLSISRDIVKSHEGSLSFASSNAGTSFILELPLASEAAAA